MTRSVLGCARRWRAIVAGNSPLVRRSDQLYGVIVILAIAVSAGAVPCVADMQGTLSAGHIHAIDEQARTTHQVQATALADSTSQITRFSAVTTVQARWVASGALRTDMVRTAGVIRAGKRFPIWIDVDGNPRAAPSDGPTAAEDAAAAAVILWLCIAASCAGLVLITRIAVVRQRHRAWDRELREFADNDDGWADRPA